MGASAKRKVVLSRSFDVLKNGEAVKMAVLVGA